MSRAEAGYVEGTKGLEPYLSRRRVKLMVATSKIILPYEPGCVANKEADKRRKETKERCSSASANLPCLTAINPDVAILNLRNLPSRLKLIDAI